VAQACNHTLCKNKLKMDLNVKHKTIKLEKITGENFWDLWLGKRFLTLMQKQVPSKETLTHWASWKDKLWTRRKYLEIIGSQINWILENVRHSQSSTLKSLKQSN
jgi:hypothetical protein